MKNKKVQIDKNGRISIPSIVRKKLHINPGEELFLEYDDDMIKISTYRSHSGK